MNNKTMKASKLHGLLAQVKTSEVKLTKESKQQIEDEFNEILNESKEEQIHYTEEVIFG